MNEHVRQILLTLQELLAAHRELIQHANEKTQAIRTENVEMVSLITGREKKCVQRIVDLEQTRLLQVGRYTVEQGLRNMRSLKMEKLIQMVYHAEQKLELQHMWRELSAAIKTLQDVNTFNQQLVRMNLDYLQFTQDLLLGAPEDEVTYHRAVQGMNVQRASRYNLKT
jgi:flagellar biosynthesis/type III secretory pathway chaperone